MKVTDEKINSTALEMIAAVTEEKKIAFRKKLFNLCLAYKTGAEYLNGEVLTNVKIREMSSCIDDDDRFYRANTDNISFSEGFVEACSTYNPNRGDFVSYLNFLIKRHFSRLRQERYLEKGGIRFDSSMKKSYRELNDVIKAYSAEYPFLKGKRINQLSNDEVDFFISIISHNQNIEKIEKIKIYFDKLKIMYLDSGAEDGYKKLEKKDESAEIISMNITDVPYYIEILKQVYLKTSRIRKGYYSCFNMQAGAAVQVLLEQIEPDAEYMEWLLREFVAGRQRIVVEMVSDINDRDIAAYREVDPGSVSKQKTSYRKDVKSLLLETS